MALSVPPATSALDLTEHQRPPWTQTRCLTCGWRSAVVPASRATQAQVAARRHAIGDRDHHSTITRKGARAELLAS